MSNIINECKKLPAREDVINEMTSLIGEFSNITGPEYEIASELFEMLLKLGALNSAYEI